MIKCLRAFVMASGASLCACGSGTIPHQGARIEATATATASSSGEAAVRAPTAGEQARIDRSADQLEQISKLYPAPNPPFGKTGSRVIRVSDDGVFELANGDHIYMDGVRCSTTGLEYIRRLLIDENTVVIITRRSAGTPTPADLWSAKGVDGLPSPMYSAIAETALTSGWCNTAASATNPQNKRYEALSALRD